MEMRSKVPLILWVLVGLVELLFVQHLEASAGEWHIYKEVRTRSEDGHTLKFCKNLNGPVTAWLILGKKLEGAFKGRLPVYRIDDGSIRSIADSEKKTPKEGTYINWEIDDGKASPGQLLKEFMEGKRVVFQYYLYDGVIKEAAFDLSGCREAISELLTSRLD